jgi:hypothetical protein
MEMEVYRLDGDHFVKVHIVAPAAPIDLLSSLWLQPYPSSGAAYGPIVPPYRPIVAPHDPRVAPFGPGATAEFRPSVFDQAAVEQIMGHISTTYGASGVASYRPGHGYIDLAIKCHPAVQPFSIEFHAPTQARRSSGPAD